MSACDCKVRFPIDDDPNETEIVYCKLHAAAPELLQAVKDLLEELNDGTDATGQRLYREYGHLIAKAEGK